MLGLLKVIVVMAVIALVGGFAVHWAKDQTAAAIHRAVDTSLPAQVSAHPWAPMSHGHRVTSARVRFAEGAVTTARCHTTLGTYSVRIDHTSCVAAPPADVDTDNVPPAKSRESMSATTAAVA